MKNKLYEVSLEISKTIENCIASYKFDDDLNKIIAMSLFELSRQHFDAILILLDKNQHHSVGALLRPLVEIHYRGQWIMFIANNNEVESISNGSKQFPKLSKISQNLDEKFNTTMFSTDSVKHLHDLTHGGIEQILRFIDKTSIQTSYSSQDIDYIIETATKNICLFLSAIGLFLNDDALLQIGNKLITDFNKNLKEK